MRWRYFLVGCDQIDFNWTLTKLKWCYTATFQFSSRRCWCICSSGQFCSRPRRSLYWLWSQRSNSRSENCFTLFCSPSPTTSSAPVIILLLCHRWLFPSLSGVVSPETQLRELHPGQAIYQPIFSNNSMQSMCLMLRPVLCSGSVATAT